MATVHLPNSVITEIEELGEEIAKDNPPAAFNLMNRIYERCASLDMASPATREWDLFLRRLMPF
jgi:hypothetical protein